MLIVGKCWYNTKIVVRGADMNHNYDKWVIIILSIQVTIMGAAISHLAYKYGYEKGRASVYNSFADSPDVGTCYQAGGCGDLPQTKRARAK